MKSKILLTVTVTILFISCQKKASVQTSINGVWESIGAGWVLQIQDSTTYSFYDVNSISCLPVRKAKLDEIIASLTLKTDTLSQIKGVMTYKFTKIEKLPELCNQVLSEKKKKDPIYNFEVFSETVKEHYAYMKLNDINWQKVYEQQKQKLNTNSSDTELYRILEETLEILNDNHAFLEATEEVEALLEEIEEEEENVITTEEELPEYGDFQVADMVAKHHFTEDMTKDSWLMKWGKMDDSIGFIEVKAMWLYADLEVSDLLIKEKGYVDAYIETFHQMDEGSYIQKEIAGVRKIMNTVMNDLMDTKYMVVDLRFNGGGQDAVNFEILKRFNDQRRQIVIATLKHGDDFSPKQPLYLEAPSNAYTKPVFVLTSKQTGSASEAFAIGSIAIPHVKRIGTPTQGAISTALEKTLPNGWSFSISNEIYMDNNGNSYENIGVPVDYHIEYPKDRQTFFRSVADNLDADKQSILKAIEELQKK